MQCHISNLCYFGIVHIESQSLAHDIHIEDCTNAIDKTIPCRAYYKLQEAIKYVPLQIGHYVLDIGASPVRLFTLFSFLISI